MDIVKGIFWGIVALIFSILVIAASIAIVVVVTIGSAAIPAGIVWLVSSLAGWGWDFFTLLAIWTIVFLGIALIKRA